MITSQKNSKIGKIKNISLPPGTGCVQTQCLNRCYAVKAFRMYPSVRGAWTHNLEHVLRDTKGFFKALQEELAAYKGEFFRWHVSGDILSPEYFRGMIETARRHPGIKFLAFTKAYSIVNRSRAEIPGNLRIVFSSWPGLRLRNPKSFPVAYLDDGTRELPTGLMECSGSCDSCFLCWSLQTGEGVKFKVH